MTTRERANAKAQAQLKELLAQDGVITDRILPVEKTTKNTVRYEDRVLNIYLPFLLLEGAGFENVTPRAVRVIVLDASDQV